MKRDRIHIALTAAAILAAAIHGCGPSTKVRRLSQEAPTATLRLVKEETAAPELKLSSLHRDTLKVEDIDGKEVFIMKAYRDEEGEMVANDVLDAAIVTARFRNVAERHGKVDLEFQVVVPESMQDGAWQLRFYPDMYILEDSVRLDPVVITGREYRRAQLKGYQQYERFLASIVSDTTKFINIGLLEIFLRRNIPQIYAFKTDSTEVSDEEFASVYGVTEREAVDHYTNKFARSRNNRRLARRDRMYRKYVKVPIVTEGLRLDTVLQAVNGDFIYNYVQTINPRPRLKKVDIVLSGDIWESDRRIYTVPRSAPLTFYISSLSSFVDPAEKYLTRVVGRRVEANTACYVEFAAGRSDVDLARGNNASEIGRIRDNLAQLLRNETFDLDSIVVTADCSPEGAWSANERLSQRRSEGISSYFRSWMRRYADSLSFDRGLQMDMDGNITSGEPLPDIRFISHNNPENWPRLDVLIQEDTLLSAQDKASYRRIRETADPDARERALQGAGYYRYLRESVYPYLRTARFDFHLHRKGMVKDTLHTTELDSTYMRGVQAIRDRDYETAVTLLRPYRDYNTAVAYCAM
ncbi:MAG: hypothetical protein IJ904_04835, partial [Candidatus Methanomethylophilaceae archaeon]|nr:hypothetical protein [Candidatus Methanomethylophilaceae archaeon]